MRNIFEAIRQSALGTEHEDLILKALDKISKPVSLKYIPWVCEICGRKLDKNGLCSDLDCN